MAAHVASSRSGTWDTAVRSLRACGYPMQTVRWSPNRLGYETDIAYLRSISLRQDSTCSSPKDERRVIRTLLQDLSANILNLSIKSFSCVIMQQCQHPFAHHDLVTNWGRVKVDLKQLFTLFVQIGTVFINSVANISVVFST